MSKTMAVEVVPIQDWHCMAVQAAEALSKIASGNLPAADFPKGVLCDVERFLDSVSEAIRFRLYDRIPSNPPASLQNYIYAWDAWINCDAFNDGDQNKNLLVISLFMHDLRDEHVFTAGEKKEAWRVAQFFKALAAMSTY